MRSFVKILWLVAISAFFSACVDINLKSELPKVDYYALDNIALSRANCGAHDIVAIEAIEIPARFAGKNIFYSDKNRVNRVEGINLNDSLKGSLESMLIKSLANHCIKAITPPFSGIKIERFLRIKVIDFGAEKNANNANMGVESRGDLEDSTHDSKGDSTHDSSKKAQNLAKISFVFVLHQNGTILQSGIITEHSAISDFSGEEIFNALQHSTNTALKSLVNKMVPK